MHRKISYTSIRRETQSIYFQKADETYILYALMVLDILSNPC